MTGVCGREVCCVASGWLLLGRSKETLDGNHAERERVECEHECPGEREREGEIGGEEVGDELRRCGTVQGWSAHDAAGSELQ